MPATGTPNVAGPSSSGLADALGMSSNYTASAANGQDYQWGGPSVGYEQGQEQRAMQGTSAQIDKGAGSLDAQNARQVNAGQNTLAQQLAIQASGKGVSAADLQLQKGSEDSMNNALSLARSAQGPGRGVANVMAQSQNAKTMAQTNQQLGIQRAQEQMAAQQQLGGLYAQQRAQDLQSQGMSMDQAYHQAQLEQNQNQINMQGALGYNSNAVQVGQGIMQGGIAQGQNQLGAEQINAGQSQANAGAMQSIVGGLASGAGKGMAAMAASDENLKADIVPTSGAVMDTALNTDAGPVPGATMDVGRKAVSEGTKRLQDENDDDKKPKTEWSKSPNPLVAGGEDLGTGLGMLLSDERYKTAIRGASLADTIAQRRSAMQLAVSSAEGGHATADRAGNPADGFLDALSHSQSTYRYKDPHDEPTARPTGGRYLGVIAQDVEKTPTGKTLVKDTPHGKYLDSAPTLSAALAGLGRLHERMKKAGI